MSAHELARIQAECNRVLDAFMDALNAYDGAGMERCMHYPHPRIAAGKVVVYDAPGSNPMDLFDRLKKEDGWSYSRWVKREVIQCNERKAHVALSRTRAFAPTIASSAPTTRSTS